MADMQLADSPPIIASVAGTKHARTDTDADAAASSYPAKQVKVAEETKEKAPPAVSLLTCPICRLPLRGPRFGACGHVFCRVCIQAQMDNEALFLNARLNPTSLLAFPAAGKAKCPTCCKTHTFGRLYLDLESISSEHIDDCTVPSPLRCAYSAVLKAQSKYPGFYARYIESAEAGNITEYMMYVLIELVSMYAADVMHDGANPPSPALMTRILNETGLSNIEFVSSKGSDGLLLSKIGMYHANQYIHFFYPGVQIIAIIGAVAADNATNRWFTGDLQIPPPPVPDPVPHKVDITYGPNQTVIGITDRAAEPVRAVDDIVAPITP